MESLHLHYFLVKFFFIKIFQTISISLGDLPISNGTDENGIENDIDSDLRVILRKLTKKDSTTKIRVKIFKKQKSVKIIFVPQRLLMNYVIIVMQMNLMIKFEVFFHFLFHIIVNGQL